MHKALRLSPLRHWREHVGLSFTCRGGSRNSAVGVFASRGVSLVLLRQYPRRRTDSSIHGGLPHEFLADAPLYSRDNTVQELPFANVLRRSAFRPCGLG